MAFNVDAQVYVPAVIPKPPAKAPAPGGGVYDSAQRSAQAFVDSLPQDVRERIGQERRNPQQGRPDFDQASETENQGLEREAPRRQLALENGFDRPLPAPTYSSPDLSPSSVLLQAQISGQGEGYNRSFGVSDNQRAAINDAYISAGAQPGGRTAALQAQIERQERASELLIVPPVLTSLNLTA